MFRKGSLTLSRKKDNDAPRRQHVVDALAKEATPRFRCRMSEGDIAGLLVFSSPDQVLFVQGEGGTVEDVRIVETIPCDKVTTWLRDGGGLVVRWDKKSEAVFVSDAAEVLLVTFDRHMLRWVGGVSVFSLFSPRKETLRQSLTPDSPNPSKDFDESDEDADTLVLDRSAASRFPEKCSMTQRLLPGPRFPGLWMIRLKKAVSDLVEKVPCVLVASSQGLAVLLPSMRLFKPFYWSVVPSFGSTRETFGVFEMQKNRVRTRLLLLLLLFRFS